MGTATGMDMAAHRTARKRTDIPVAELLRARVPGDARRRYLGAMLVVASSAHVATQVQAAEWRLTPRLGLKETYTDNVRLAPRGLEQSDWITEISPGVSVAANGARLQMSADYALNYRAYANNSDANGHNHSLRSNALFNAWDRRFFLQAAASVAQQNISTLGALTSSDANLTGNRTEVRQFSLSPYLVGRLGTFANWQGRFSWNRSESDGVASALNSETRGLQLSLSSGQQFSDLGWSLAYSQQQVDSSGGQFARRDQESMTATVRYRVWPTLSALGTFGRDDNSFGNARGSTGGDFYTLGLEWAPSTRTKLRGELGERYFGNTASFNAEHRTRLSTWQLSYSEQIIANPRPLTVPASVDTAVAIDRLFLAQVPDPIERQQLVQAYIVQNGLPASLTTAVDFLTNQVSLSKRLQGTFGLRGIRSTFLLSVFRDNRESQTTDQPVLVTDPFALGTSVVQTGYSGVLTWRFSEQTSASFSAGQTKSKVADASRDDTNSTLRIGATHRLGPKLTGSVDYRWLNRDSTASGQDVRENAITGTLNMAF